MPKPEAENKKQAPAKRPFPGRPVVIKDGKKVMVFLDPESLEKARLLGEGNISAGVRRAISLADCPS